MTNTTKQVVEACVHAAQRELAAQRAARGLRVLMLVSQGMSYGNAAAVVLGEKEKVA